MKLNKIAFAGMILISGLSISNFASATLSTAEQAVLCAKATAPTAAQAVDYMACKPAYSYVVAGSSALAANLDSTIKSLFADGSPIMVQDMSSAYGYATGQVTGAQSLKIYFGVKLGTTKPMVIYYQNFNGSAAGVSMLMGKKTEVPESSFIDLTKGGTASTCTSVVASVTTVQCTGMVSQFNADLAISDVAVTDLLAGTTTNAKGIAGFKLDKFNQTPLLMQGFGVAVSLDLYKALQAKQFSDSTTPTFAACDGKYTLECQPSISRLQYSTLTSKSGNITTVNGLVGTTNLSGPLTIARRDEASGTQATSQMFFNGSGCGKTYSSASTSVRRAGDPAAGDLVVTESASGGLVEAALKVASSSTTPAYVIGVLPLSSAAPLKVGGTSASYEKLYSVTTGSIKENWRFVKLDGVSPDLNDATFDTDNKRNMTDKVRGSMLNGTWPLQVKSYSYSLLGAPDAKVGITTALNAKLRDPLTDAPGVTYLTGGAAYKTTVSKSLTNCSPLILTNTP